MDKGGKKILLLILSGNTHGNYSMFVNSTSLLFSLLRHQKEAEDGRSIVSKDSAFSETVSTVSEPSALDPLTTPHADHTLEVLSDNHRYTGSPLSSIPSHVQDRGYQSIDSVMSWKSMESFASSISSFGDQQSFGAASSIPSLSTTDNGYGTASFDADYGSIQSQPQVVQMRTRKVSQGNRYSADSLSHPTATSIQAQHKTAVSRSESWHEHSATQKLLEYATRMNFTQPEFDNVMRNHGSDIDRDELLKQLVKQRDSSSVEGGASKAAGLPVSALHTSSSKHLIQHQTQSQSQQKPEGDSRGLRRIVIDGSNVAME